MSAQIVSVTVQAALFSAVSTTLAQSLTMYQQQKFHVDPTTFLKFIIIAIITTPPNYLYQRWLEDKFPSRPSSPPPKKLKADDDLKAESTTKTPKDEDRPLSKSNTAAKFFLDQSIGASANTVAFIVLAGLLAGKGMDRVGSDIQNNFYSMLSAGWRVWPMVTLLNLVVVPFEYRMMVGNAAGVLWGVYMNLKAI